MPTSNADSSKYLSLKTAAELYGYTRDHLGLMIRKGKLQGIKLGSYYVTTNDWMAEYVKKFADPGHPTSKNKMSNKFLTGILDVKKNVKTGYLFNRENKSRHINDNINKNQSLEPLSNKIETKSNFEKEISKELSILSPINYLAQAEDEIDSHFFLKDINTAHPYVILPIREMKTDERNNILSKIGRKENNKDTA